MKKLILSFLTCASLLTAKEFPPLAPSENLNKEIKQFVYFSGGVHCLLPTLSVGYRKIYGPFASDFSFSGSFFPSTIFLGSRSNWQFSPTIHYKQLFLLKGRNNGAFYFGPQLGFDCYEWGDYRSAFNFGGVVGIQIKRKKGVDFFEFGASYKDDLLPSLSYGIGF